MLETVFAVFFITTIFLLVFQVAHMVTARTLLDHAAARAARARSVGFNDWMCLKAARVAMIPVAGECTWPERSVKEEAAFISAYMQTDNMAVANGILDYERWDSMRFSVESGIGSEVSAAVAIDVPRFYSRGDDESDTAEVLGEAKIESHFPLYMNNQGL